MNTSDPLPPGTIQPPPLHPPAPAPAPAPEPEPLGGGLSVLEALLREPNRVWHALRGGDAGRVIAVLLGAALLCAALYGLVIGSFSKGTQLWAAPVKVTLGLFFSVVICLPSLYIFASLGGARTRLIEAVGLTAGLLAQNTLLLVGFAPVAWIFSESTDSIGWMGAMHLAFWFVSCSFGFRFFVAGFEHLNARDLGGIRVWLVMFVIVVLQMSTALRPLIGTSDDFLPKEKRFFLMHWFEQMDGGK